MLGTVDMFFCTNGLFDDVNQRPFVKTLLEVLNDHVGFRGKFTLLPIIFDQAIKLSESENIKYKFLVQLLLHIRSLYRHFFHNQFIYSPNIHCEFSLDDLLPSPLDLSKKLPDDVLSIIVNRWFSFGSIFQNQLTSYISTGSLDMNPHMSTRSVMLQQVVDELYVLNMEAWWRKFAEVFPNYPPSVEIMNSFVALNNIPMIEEIFDLFDTPYMCDQETFLSLFVDENPLISLELIELLYRNKEAFTLFLDNDFVSVLSDYYRSLRTVGSYKDILAERIDVIAFFRSEFEIFPLDAYDSLKDWVGVL